MHISAYASRGFAKLTKQPQKGLADRGFNVEPLMALARETGNLGMTVGGPREEHHQDDNKQESDQTEEPVTQEHDPPMESLLARGTTEDHWRVATGFFFRVHMKPRTAVYTPSADDFPGDINRVSHARVTHKSFSDGCTSQVTDERGMVREADESNDQPWTGDLPCSSMLIPK